MSEEIDYNRLRDVLDQIQQNQDKTAGGAPIPIPNQSIHFEAVCPRCGYCPHCGRV